VTCKHTATSVTTNSAFGLSYTTQIFFITKKWVAFWVLNCMELRAFENIWKM